MKRHGGSRWWCVSIALLLAWVSPPGLLQGASISVSSPDKKVRLEILQQEGGLFYRVNFKGKPVIETSPLVVTIDDIPFTRDLKLEPSALDQSREVYSWRGVHSQATNHFNSRSVKARSPRGILTLELRAFNDGVAFRQILSLNESE